MARSTIRRYAVVGAGNMGSGIAQKIATEGFPVVLLDREQSFVERGLATIRRLLDEAVVRKIKTESEVAEILGRVEGTTDWGRLADVDLVVEAVFEDLDVKREVFAKLAAVCRPDAILATNTSSFYVSDVAAAVNPAPQRVVGLHYFFHPAKNRLVEVLGHAGSDPAVV
ncbi:MAG: 3-hydroxyacyl-CoA dehydrogenase/enoyl-CoA hydratase family protein, partial [Acidimicrobiia bacterium]|nr:3-hydroxyacyl-CoA dehydrogenase/enoyl-CoA hydratase family protein [Acidimicrobiia bacterium]